jgi:hypothetical protein
MARPQPGGDRLHNSNLQGIGRTYVGLTSPTAKTRYVYPDARPSLVLRPCRRHTERCVVQRILQVGTLDCRYRACRHSLSRHLSFVTNAFAGIPTLIKEAFDPEGLRANMKTSDIL